MTTTTVQTPIAPAAVQSRFASWRRILLIVVAVVVLVGATYLLAWYEASSLARTYLGDADTSYDAGKYLDALVGYEEFDPARNAYVAHGGYLQVERIWADEYAWPRPAGVERAQARIDEIINERMSVQEAEQFIQANTGKQNPYFGVIYLRLGELYEQEGDTVAAKDIYSSIAELFPGEDELIARAGEHLAQLEGQ